MKFLTNIEYNGNLRKIINHSIAWLFFIFYELFLFYSASGQLAAIANFLFYYACNIGLFYCQIHLLNITLNDSKSRYIKLVILFIVEIIAVLFIKMFADLYFTDFSRSTVTKFQMIKAMGTLDLLRNIYYAAFGTLYWTMKNINNYQKKADAAEIKNLKNAKDHAELAIQLAKAENAYLQQQINPHLLFNSLNFIHSSVYKYSPEAAENIILLSDIMRYTFEDTDADGKISVFKESEQIVNLIKINQHRFGQTLEIAYTKEGDLSGYKIIPLVLLTLAENLFKHGDLRNQQAMIKLHVTENGELRFYTFNHKRPRPPVNRVKSIGLANIRIRLNYTYGSSYKLSVNETADNYESELLIQL